MIEALVKWFLLLNFMYSNELLQELMEYEMPRNMGNMDYEKKLELSNNELENANREVMILVPSRLF